MMCFFTIGQSKAQSKIEIDPCRLVREEIIPLRTPNFDQSALWKKISGVKGIERPRTALPVVDGGQIFIGSSVPFDDKTGLGLPQIQMVRTDRVGKVIVEKWINVKGLKTVADAILLKDRIVILSQLGTDNDDVISLQFLNGIGEERNAKIISDPRYRLNPKSMVSVTGGTQMIIAAEAISRKNLKDTFSVLIWVDKEGKKIIQKEYLPGVQNRPEFIGRLDKGETVMTGRVVDENGRDSGWVLRLSSKGEIIYQRPYPRGGDSVIRRAASLGNGAMIVVGDTLPSAAGDKAAWIMELDKQGNPVWQKYLTGKYKYSGVDVIALGDGRYNMLIAGQPTNEGGRQYARVLTLTSEGVIIGDESFIEASNSIPVRIINQNGKRVILGLAETGFSKDGVANDLKYAAYDMWMMGLAPLPEYTNSCAGSPNRTLDDLP